MLIAWLTVMTLDYISGTMVACKAGQWASATAWELWHKGSMIAVVLAAAIADWVMVLIVIYVPIGLQWPEIILPLVLAWYIITELGFFLESTVKMGANVPAWLVKLLKASAHIVQTAGDMTADKQEPADMEEIIEEKSLPDQSGRGYFIPAVPQGSQ